MSVPRTVLFLLMVVASASTLGIDLSDVTELLEFGGQVFSKVISTWEEVGPERDHTAPGEYVGPEIVAKRRRERKVLSRIYEVGRMIGQVENAVQSSTAATVAAVLNNLPDIVRLELRLDRLAGLMADVSSRERDLALYIETGYDNSSETDGNPDKSAWRLERHTLIDFAQHAVGHGESVRTLLQRIHSLVAPAKDSINGKSVFLSLKDALNKQGGVQCDTKQSPQQLLINLFRNVQLVQLQGFSVMQFSWMLLRLYDKGNFTLEPKIAADKFKKNQEKQVAMVREVLKDASRTFWRCDPDIHKEGETYEQLTRLLQGFLVNEVDLNGDESCKQECPFYTYAETHGCYSDQFCSQQPRCHGRLLKCQFFDSDMWVCPSKNTTYSRDNWIEYEDGTILGHKEHCMKGTTKVDSWWRFWYHCSYCMCLCDEEGPNSDRYFSLRPVLSDIERNKVVTGMRFVKRNRIIHFQIEQAVVKAHGVIDKSTQEWREVDAFSLYGRQIQEGQDYFKMDWEQRAIDLDDHTAKDGYVLTGVQFRRLGSHLNMVIRATPIDMENGRLRPDGSIWVDNDNTASNLNNPRSELLLSKPDVSTKSSAPVLPDSKGDTFIKFTNTDMRVDVAQTTVPFIDIQPVDPDPPVLLSGAGIYHKGQKGYGGFVAPKIFTYDLSMNVLPIQSKDGTDGNVIEYFV